MRKPASGADGSCSNAVTLLGLTLNHVVCSRPNPIALPITAIVAITFSSGASA
jgi:hypothetical protein